MGTVIARENGAAPTLSVLRNPHGQPFDEQNRQAAQFLVPHLGRAWIVAKRLDMLTAGESLLDTLPTGVVFLDSGGTLIYCNHAAEEIFCAQDGISLRNRVPVAAHALASAQIQRMIQSALSPSQRPGPLAVPVPRPSLRRDYQMMAAPLRGTFPHSAGMAQPAVLLLLVDPERQPTTNTELLIQLYKLTRKEAAMAAKLAQAKTVEQAAEELEITYETARTHLRRIFSKTGTSRQAELLLLIARLPTVDSEGPRG